MASTYVLLSFLLVLCFRVSLTDKPTKKFVFGLPEIRSELYLDHINVYLSAKSTSHVYLESPGVNFFKNLTVREDTVEVVQLPHSDFASGTGISSRGVYIESENDVTVHVMVREEHNTDGFLALPLTPVSKSFYVASYTPLKESEFTITALEDGTMIAIKMKLDSGFVSYSGISYHDDDILNLTLNRLQTFELQSTNDITGTFVTSDKPISVVSGNKCAYVPYNEEACDILIEQMPPVSTWGNLYLTTNLKTRANNRLRILSSAEQNTVQIGTIRSVILNSGEFYEFVSGDDIALNIRGEKPILVIQYAEGTTADNELGDPSMILVPSLVGDHSEYLFATDSVFPYHYISITVRTRDARGLLLDGQTVSQTDARDVEDVDGSGLRTSYSIIRTEVLNGQHHIRHVDGSVKFAVILYGFGEDESYGFPLGFTHVPSFKEIVTSTCTTSHWNLQINMEQLDYLYPGSVATNIYLGEDSCTGQLIGNRLIFNSSIDHCRTATETTTNEIIHSNELVYAYHDPNTPFIIRNINWTLDIKCHVLRNQSTESHVTIDNTVTGSQGVLNDTAQYRIITEFYSDPNFQAEISGAPLQVPVGDHVLVRAYILGVDWNIKMRLHSCFTTQSADLTGSRYYLIQNGCEVDPNTHYLSQTDHETRFVFQSFEITGVHHDVYIKCEETICDKSDVTSAPQCDQRCS